MYKTTNSRIKKIREHFCNDSNKEFANRVKIPVNQASNWVNDADYNAGKKVLDKILKAFPEVNGEWLYTGKGPVLKSDSVQIYNSENAPTGRKLIPFYDDVVSIGGNNDRVVNMDGTSAPSDYIDTGDWFKDSTAAIRHYGESMVEYPPGCILALKEVINRELIIPGFDYMIETSECRVTKRVQKGKDPEHITAYSTNPEKYPDGRLIHEPFDIPLRAINRNFIGTWICCQEKRRNNGIQ